MSNFIKAVNPATKQQLPEEFPIATPSQIDQVVANAYTAWKIFKNTSGEKKAEFLNAIAEEIETLGDVLVKRAMAESGLPEGRIKGERGRTCGQLRLFATFVKEGSWVNAIIDEAMPDRQPMPRVDMRKMLQSLGPVAIFGASNFPLAFSTAGGDTASALAAGCPVVVKGHPSHPGTNKLVSAAISKAAKRCGLPNAVFASIDGGVEVGQQLVMHPLIKAVGFTGSLGGGNAIMKTANQRPEPIPVYAEMGSINPIFIMPSQLNGDLEQLASTLANSINMGAGQFCTNPGVIVLPQHNHTEAFIKLLGKAFEQLTAYTMLNEGIFNHFESCKAKAIQDGIVEVVFQKKDSENWVANPAFVTISANKFIENRLLHNEVFGPFSIGVVCESMKEMHDVVESLEGQLTGTFMGDDAEMKENIDLIDALSEKVGRVIFNGVPTGVEVSYAMHHGGPYPASSNGMYTSVGTDAIYRFARPICYQSAPQSILPVELKDNNPTGIWRIVNGESVKR